MTATTRALTHFCLNKARHETRDAVEELMTSEVSITRGDDALLDSDGELDADPDARCWSTPGSATWAPRPAR